MFALDVIGVLILLFPSLLVVIIITLVGEDERKSIELIRTVSLT